MPQRSPTHNLLPTTVAPIPTRSIFIATFTHLSPKSCAPQHLLASSPEYKPIRPDPRTLIRLACVRLSSRRQILTSAKVALNFALPSAFLCRGAARQACRGGWWCECRRRVCMSLPSVSAPGGTPCTAVATSDGAIAWDSAHKSRFSDNGQATISESRVGCACPRTIVRNFDCDFVDWQGAVVLYVYHKLDMGSVVRTDMRR
ncbi:uncharacterized protein V1518DRAFT_143909 [Limtongia smithiae]|uniref:uncharacterized protein n=1 Tax=Limtongia smithiae TaxID=1125753 RepID=UPI0034CE033E